MKAFLVAFVLATGLTIWSVANDCSGHGGDTCAMSKGFAMFLWPFLMLLIWPFAFALGTAFKSRNSDKKDE